MTDDFHYGRRMTRGEFIAQELDRLGITPDAPTSRPQIEDGDLLLRDIPYLKGCTFTAMGEMRGQEDEYDGRYDVTWWQCVQHPRLDVQTRSYTTGAIYRIIMVDKAVMPDFAAAAAMLEKVEPKSGIYPRPTFTVGDPDAE